MCVTLAKAASTRFGTESKPAVVVLCALMPIGASAGKVYLQAQYFEVGRCMIVYRLHVL